MTFIPAQQIAIPSLLASFQAAQAGGDTLTPQGKSFITVKCGATGATVTVVVPGNDEYGNAKPDMPVVVAANTERDIPVWSGGFLDQSTNLVSITYSQVTTVTVAHKVP